MAHAFVWMSYMLVLYIYTYRSHTYIKKEEEDIKREKGYILLQKWIIFSTRNIGGNIPRAMYIGYIDNQPSHVYSYTFCGFFISLDIIVCCCPLFICYFSRWGKCLFGSKWDGFKDPGRYIYIYLNHSLQMSGIWSFSKLYIYGGCNMDFDRFLFIL